MRQSSFRSRRRRLLAVGTIIVGLLVQGCSPEPERRPRNLVVICLDTLRTSRLEPPAPRPEITPFLRSLTRRAVWFPNVQSSSNWTVPAVGSLFTGLRPSRHGAVLPGERKNLGVDPKFPNGLADEVPTLPEIVRDRGFRTALFSGNPFLYGRFQSGFDRIEVERAPGRAHLPQIEAWLAEKDSRPFFLYWQIMDLHQPLEPPHEYERLFAPDAPAAFPTDLHRNWGYHNLTPEVAEGEEFRRYRELKLALYDATLRHVDDLLRGFFQSLEREQLDKDTLVVITADHGEEFWDHALDPSQAELDPRGYSGVGHGHTMYQELLHVPLLVVDSRLGPRQIQCPISLLDLFPTVLAEMGIAMPSGVDGVDLGPTIRDPRAPCPRRALASEAPAYGPESRAVRVGRWKLERRRGQEPRLFDLRTDPEERTDVSERFPDVVRSLAPATNPVAPESGVTGTDPAGIDIELEQQLRALGYLN